MSKTEATEGILFQSPNPDEARLFFKNNRKMGHNKICTPQEAVSRYITDECYLAIGGFGTNRIPTVIIHEILRAKLKNMGFLGHTSTHDFQLLCAGNCINRVDSAYIVGLEARGLSRNSRRVIESGEVKVTEWSNYSLAIRLNAAAQGVSFGIVRSLLGTETLLKSPGRVIECPFTRLKYVAVPALWPDVSVIHVHEADSRGNARIKGITVADLELAKASKRLVITTERLISNDEIRNDPAQTVIPGILVDAVVIAPYGSYPGNMPYEYFSDEKHLKEWLEAEKNRMSLTIFYKNISMAFPVSMSIWNCAEAYRE